MLALVCQAAGDEIHLYEVPATNLLLVRRAKRSTDLLGYLLYDLAVVITIESIIDFSEGQRL